MPIHNVTDTITALHDAKYKKSAPLINTGSTLSPLDFAPQTGFFSCSL